MFLQAPTEKLQVIADSVKRLSNYYIDNPEAETPWNDKYCQTAYRHYYLPLNFIRNQLVIKRGLQTDFFIGLTDFIDWGSGPGTASLALADSEILKKQIKKQILFDSSSTVFKVFDDLKNNLINASTDIQLNLKNIQNTKNSCLIFSYSLTEVSALPAGWNQFEALMILEPSTSEDGRKLLHTRNLLIENGYTIWAPCTHQLACPLLIHSKNDWCHDRAHVKSPVWFTDLEKLLPMKNKTVTTSYLLARKTKPTNLNPQSARLTGDSLAENGKTRQLVCRNEQREYLAWMHKSITPQTLARGEMLDLPLDIEMKSNELRVKTPLTTK